jgi:hypothetical protein
MPAGNTILTRCNLPRHAPPLWYNRGGASNQCSHMMCSSTWSNIKPVQSSAYSDSTLTEQCHQSITHVVSLFIVVLIEKKHNSPVPDPPCMTCGVTFAALQAVSGLRWPMVQCTCTPSLLPQYGIYVPSVHGFNGERPQRMLICSTCKCKATSPPPLKATHPTRTCLLVQAMRSMPPSNHSYKPYPARCWVQIRGRLLAAGWPHVSACVLLSAWGQRQAVRPSTLRVQRTMAHGPCPLPR